MNERAHNQDKELAVVFMVAGISSRFGGRIKQFAKISPKEETLIEYSLNQALSAGFNQIIFIVGNKTEEPFKKIFSDNYKGIPIKYVLQKYNPELRDKPWGTTDAVVSATGIINCPFVVCNGDDIYGEEPFKILVNHLKTKETCATIGFRLGECLSENGSVNRGIFELNPDNTVESITETLDITPENLNSKNLSEENLCSQNIFALQPEVLKMLQEILTEFKKEKKGGRNSEALLPKDLSRLISEGKVRMRIYQTPEKWTGVTNPGDEVEVRKNLKKMQPPNNKLKNKKEKHILKNIDIYKLD